MPDTLAELYEKLEPRREPYLRRARDAASLTVPTLFPEQGHDGQWDFDDPFQSIGAMGVASVSSKFQLTMFPPGLDFFEIQLDPQSVADAERAGQNTQIQQAKKDSELRTQIIAYHLEGEAFRARMSEVFPNLVVGGNILLREKKDGTGLRLHRLPSYVCDVDGEDNLLAVVVRERVSRRGLPPDLLAVVSKKDDPVDIYTGWLKREGSPIYDAWQEYDNKAIANTRAEYPTRELLPVHPARFDPCCGEPYGRGLVDRMIGDIASLEGLAQSTVELAAEAARLVWLHNPNGPTTPEMLAEAPNGAHRWGNAEDVTALKLDKNGDMQLVLGAGQGLRNDLQTAFFMRQSIQRDAERVTAVEIQTLAQELDETMGGAYSILSAEIQLPILRMTEARLVKAGKLPAVKEGSGVKTRIIAGLEGLGRGIRLRQMSTFLTSASRVPPDEAMGFDIDRRKVLEELAHSSGVGTRYLRTTEQASALRKARSAQIAQQQLGPEMVRQGGQIVRDQLQPT